MKSCCLRYGKGKWPFAGNGLIVLTTIAFSILAQACIEEVPGVQITTRAPVIMITVPGFIQSLWLTIFLC
jgi:hypothetical protein